MGQGTEYGEEDAYGDEAVLEEEEREEMERENERLKTKNEGKFAIRNKNGLYLVDRQISKRFWWTRDMNIALILASKDYARKICSKLKYNYPYVEKLY